MLISNIRYRMADRKMDDLSELMELTGLTRNTLKKLYRTSELQTIKLENLMHVCDALHCSLADLIQYVPDDIND